MSSYTIPAIVGHMGSTRYYQAVMRADELAATVHAAMDFPEFGQFLVSERMQRALSEERVEKMIVPYLTRSSDRFFGSIIVLVYQPDKFFFEELHQLGVSNLPRAYRGIEHSLGALTIEGGMLFALDGQHRLHALRTVINERKTPRLGLQIDGPYRDDVKDDMLSVIFLEFDSTEKSRRIFNKVNRYAKPTTKSTNILMSEDDGYAIIARCLASLDDPEKFDSNVAAPIPLNFDEPIPVLRLEGSALKPNDMHLTTLELVYKSVEAICTSTGRPPLDEASTIVRPEDYVLRDAYEECACWWQELMDNYVPFQDAMSSPRDLPGWREIDSRDSVAYRPNGQEALLRGLMDAHNLSNLSCKELVEMLNEVPVCFNDEIWRGVLLGGGEKRNRVINFKPLAANLVTYMLVGPGVYGARRTQMLLDAYIEAKSEYGLSADSLPEWIA